jgi:hypothetical protein
VNVYDPRLILDWNWSSYFHYMAASMRIVSRSTIQTDIGCRILLPDEHNQPQLDFVIRRVQTYQERPKRAP